MNTEKATPTPWEVANALSGKVFVAMEHKTAGMAGHQICEMIPGIKAGDHFANAELIVKAVNTYAQREAVIAELLEAGKEILESADIQECPSGKWSTADTPNYWRRVKLEEAIAKAEALSSEVKP